MSVQESSIKYAGDIMYRPNINDVSAALRVLIASIIKGMPYNVTNDKALVGRQIVTSNYMRIKFHCMSCLYVLWGNMAMKSYYTRSYLIISLLSYTWTGIVSGRSYCNVLLYYCIAYYAIYAIHSMI